MREGIKTNKENWEKLKFTFWDKFPKHQLFIDDNDSVAAFRKKNGKVIVVAYAHYEGNANRLSIKSNRWNSFLLGKGILDFIEDINKLVLNKCGEANIVLIFNFEIYNLLYETLIKFPKSINYYLLNDLDKKFLKPQKLAGSIRASKVREPSKRRTEYIPDTESDIMRALREGNGDLFGY